jgi:hypothetical protein
VIRCRSSRPTPSGRRRPCCSTARVRACGCAFNPDYDRSDTEAALRDQCGATASASRSAGFAPEDAYIGVQNFRLWQKHTESNSGSTLSFLYLFSYLELLIDLFRSCEGDKKSRTRPTLARYPLAMEGTTEYCTYLIPPV